MKISRDQAEAEVAQFLASLAKKGWTLSTRYDPTVFRLLPRPARDAQKSP